MKKSILLFALATAVALLLTGCGQSPAGAQTPADSTSVSSSIGDTENSSQNAPQLPEVSPDASVQPSETNQPAEETDGSGASSQGQEQTGDTSDAGGAGSGDVSAPPPVSEPPAADPPASSTGPEQTSPSASEPEQESETVTEPEPEAPPVSNTTLSGTNLTLRFGGGESFTIHMYDNPTANKIAEYVGTAAWQLPNYHFDDYDGWEKFQ